MRPYVAILKDSFREAMASRVLWVMLVIITLLLVLLAPLGLDEQPGTVLQAPDLRDSASLVRKLAAAGRSERPSPARQVWKLLPQELQTRIQEAAPAEGEDAGERIYDYELRTALNRVLRSRELYDAAAWSEVPLSSEVQRQLDGGLGGLPLAQVARLNRLLLEAAFPEEIRPAAGEELQISYLGLPLGSPLPGKREPIVQASLLVLMELLLGTVGIMAAIVVTAGIVPQTFEQGSIDLLLSKPVGRWAVFVTKVFGGCTFTLINVGYMVGGLWLLCGVRYGWWNHRLLWCIPLFLFSFAIYYAVSALSGVVWRHAIVCVVMTFLFWLACTLVGVTKQVVEFWFLNQTRVVNVLRAGEDYVRVSEGREIARWDSAGQTWQPILENPDEPAVAFGPPGPRIAGPLYDPRRELLVALVPPRFQFGSGGPGTALTVGKRAEGFKRLEGANVPSGTAALFYDDQGRFLAVNAEGIHRLEGDVLQKTQRPNIFGIPLPLAEDQRGFRRVSPPLDLTPPVYAAQDVRTGRMAVADARHLLVLSPEADGEYTVRARREGKDGESGLVALGGRWLLSASAKGVIRVLDAETLEPLASFEPEGGETPRSLAATADGRHFAVLFHNGRLWLYEPPQDSERAEGRLYQPDVADRGDVTAVSFPDEHTMLIGHGFGNVSAYRLEQLVRLETLRPSHGTLFLIYRWGIRPLYRIFPKPGELDNLTQYVLTGETTVAVGGPQNGDDLTAGRLKLDIWQPLWSNLAFVAVMLLLGSLYVQVKDF
ncbi:MAG: ABC transporter permease subunit [Pirellulales bacterium]|nr:ABC transporter permease subunit [Pirellulales bacterium]